MNKLLDPELTRDSGEEEKEKHTIVKPGDDTMFSWNGISLFNIEDDTPKSECTSITRRDKIFTSQDNAMISKENDKKLDEGKAHQNNTLNQRT